jgi:hypothetical protein
MTPRHVRVAVGAAAVAAGLLCSGLLAATPSVAGAARDCRPPDYPGSGYFTSLSVKGVSCATGRKLAVAYYRCRTENGKAGRCSRRVMRFSCTEERNRIATEIDARVRCRRGGKRVTHTYQQNL